MAHKTEHLKLSIFMFMVDFVNKLSNISFRTEKNDQYYLLGSYFDFCLMNVNW